jgi:hypothetical protein
VKKRRRVVETKINPNAIYVPSKDVVARDVQGELIIIPITAEAGGSDGEIFSLNETGRAMWDRLDGKKTLKDVARALASEFEGSAKEIEADVLGLAEELIKRGMLVEV